VTNLVFTMMAMTGILQLCLISVVQLVPPGPATQEPPVTEAPGPIFALIPAGSPARVVCRWKFCMSRHARSEV